MEYKPIRFVERPKEVKDVGEDPQLRRDEELNQTKHRNRVLFHKMLPWGVVFGITFLVALFFVILPLSEMEIGHDSFSSWFQAWAIAFRQTGGTMGIALATLIVSALLKWFVELFKKY